MHTRKHRCYIYFIFFVEVQAKKMPDVAKRTKIYIFLYIFNKQKQNGNFFFQQNNKISLRNKLEEPAPS